MESNHYDAESWGRLCPASSPKAKAGYLGAVAAARASDWVSQAYAFCGDINAADSELYGWARAAAHFGRKSLRQR